MTKKSTKVKDQGNLNPVDEGKTHLDTPEGNSEKEVMQPGVSSCDTSPEGSTNGEDQSKSSQKEAELQEVSRQVEELRVKLIELNDKYIRLAAEYDNYRKRTLKEKMELGKIEGEKLILGLLPVVDDFDRAMVHIDNVTEIGAVKEGLKLIHGKFLAFLSRQGVKEIDTSRQPFNIDLHEAVTKVPAPTEDMKGKILDCVQKGYTLDEKVIRFPKVVVGE